MTDEIKSLAKAFGEKEETEKFLSNLEKLRADNSLTPDMYSGMKTEYEQRLSTALLEIDRIKKELMTQLANQDSELEAYQKEFAKLNVKYKVGELPVKTYQRSIQKIQNAIDQVNVQRQQLISLINAESSTDITALAKKLPAATAATRPSIQKVSSKAPTAEGETKGKISGKKRMAIIGGALALVVCVFLVVFLLKPWKPKEVVIPIDLEKAANIGSLYFELVYDASSLVALGVDEVVPEGNTLIEYNVDTPGRVLVAMISSSGITGDVPVVIARFQVKGWEQQLYAFSLENAVAYDGTSFSKLSLSTTAGDFTPKDKSFLPPKMVLATPGK